MTDMESQIYHAIKEYKLAELGKPALEIIVDRLGISRLLAYFFEHNHSTAEYHSNYHSVCVALNAYEGAQYLNLSVSETRCLVLASIYHDFEHSGGITDDSSNIKRAIDGLMKAVQFEINDLTTKELTQTIKILEITKYPFEKSPTTTMEMIIRDADLMQPYENDHDLLKNQYDGLHIEIERSVTTKFTREEFAKGQQAWLDEHVKWYSSWAIAKAKFIGWEETKQRLFNTIR